MNFLHESLRKQEPKFMPNEAIRLLLLESQKIALKNNIYPGYPQQSDRLFLVRKPYNTSGIIQLPVNEKWAVGAQTPTNKEKIEEVYCNIGWPKQCKLDSNYRALHPWWFAIVNSPEIGGVTGKGFFYHWGANYTADAAVTTHDELGTPHILLVQRKDTKEWALPGGFLNDYESGVAAAMRELHEEAQVSIDARNTNPTLLYKGPVLDIRTTLHAWTETHLWNFSLPHGPLPEVFANDDANDAKWFALNNIPSELYGSHPLLIQMAISNYQTSETTGHLVAAQYHL